MKNKHMAKKALGRVKRKKRIRKKVFGTTERPRLAVFRSNKHICAQIINDETIKKIIELANDKRQRETAKRKCNGPLRGAIFRNPGH